MPTISTSAETVDFLNELSPYLAHLPAEEHADLLEELAIHLESHLDVAEAAGDSRSLRRIVGSPESFVTDYCVSAQIPLAPPVDPRELSVAGGIGREGPISRLIRQLGSWVKVAEERVLGRDAWRSFVEFLPELAPAWWVARAVLITMALGEVLGGDGAARFGQIPIPKLFGSVVVGIVVSVWLSSKSVAFGRRQRGSGRIRLANVGVAALAFVVLGTVAFAGAEPSYYPAQVVEPAPEFQTHDGFIGRSADGVYVEHPQYGELYINNLYPYDRAGNLLSDIRIFDQEGRPFEIGTTHINGWPLPVPNLYPRVIQSEDVGVIPVGPAGSISPLAD